VGWSPESVRRAAGIPQRDVAKLERGVDARASTLQRVFGALGYELTLRRDARALFMNPPSNGCIDAARDFGVDLGQLYAGFSMSPAERLDVASRSASGLAELLR
ncbi:MAG: hypothetical protein M1335_01695, partial [Chloroflexi bacterium]|nr:hypothetical protein [Chloroflexota bacterium]